VRFKSLPDSARSPRVARQAINGRTLANRRLGGRVYWAIFRNQYLVDYCKKLKMLEDFPPQFSPL